VESLFGLVVGFMNIGCSAYVLSQEKMMDIVDDYYLGKIVEERLNYKEEDLIKVDIDDL